MAFADPQSVTINAVPISLPRTGSGPSTGAFTKDDGTVVLSVAHSVGKRTRRTVRLVHSKIAPDPLISAQNIKYSMTAYLVVDVPPTGYTVAEQQDVVDGLTLWATTGAGANLLKLLGGEN